MYGDDYLSWRRSGISCLGEREEVTLAIFDAETYRQTVPSSMQY